ncbi:SDR family NAD(P)-dependent oxidoreductase [Mycolicibacterium sp. P9-22]|uniref:SDR family NAD(P)-dependent oxidoreductase n=1 Tax=Mycolicibacterium sp. P9-22 TaxID=2024613 RepID=UPI0011EE6BA0|nr:SDR family oxidoreductase [Mycolicibacterium sp. P9-22]KAA0120181.1 SDR family oxidoreductase [Mycolicibacterium sp. P9-22]
MSLHIDLSGRRALITGAGQGVGRGLAFAFASAGAEVLVNDLRPDLADEVVADVRDAGWAARSIPFDVTDYDAATSAVAGANSVDILVNNAGNAGAHGFGPRGRFADSTPQDWEPYLRVNLYGVLNCTRAVLPNMIAARWGRIVTIVSDAGRVGDPSSAVYAGSKAGAAGFIRSVALEHGRYGITANNIALGTMRTSTTEPLWAGPDSSQAKAIMQNYVVRRPGLPDDVAPLAALLASDQGAWITGQTIPVNGGFSFAQ